MSNPNRLAALRATAGLSQREAATQLGGAVTAGMVSRWERGVSTPVPHYRRRLADVYGVTVEQLGLTTEPPAGVTSPGEDYMADERDPRVAASHHQWRATRAALNASRRCLSEIAAGLYGEHQLGTTGLITRRGWMPAEPVDLSRVELTHRPAPTPVLDGTEPETALVRPQRTVARPYGRYTQAIRDLAKPRLFENRLCWRLTGVDWSGGGGRLTLDDSTYFAATDVYEALAHELAYVTIGEDGRPSRPWPALRDLPFRRLVADPFDLRRRPVLPAVSTLTIRAGTDGAEFLLHRRDPRSVTAAGGMLQVIPSGIFQPSSVLPAARASDFDLWRNLQREFSEELLGNAEHDGDGVPVDYAGEPFAALDRARASGRLRVWCLGVALDALTLFGEIMTVAVLDSDLFDELAGDFVDRNDEGRVTELMPFTDVTVAALLGGGGLAPAGAGCVELAWRWREMLLP